jgi:ABC-type lipopolysaccharide export system ATPase subunit
MPVRPGSLRAAHRQCVTLWRRDARAASGPSNGRKADAEREPSLLLPDRPLPGLAPVLVEVIFETIERIREQDATVLFMEQHALAAFEIADYLYVPEFGKLNMLGDAPKLLDESFVTAANLEGHW